MRPVYFKIDGPVERKVMADMPFLVTNNQIRFPKRLYEEGLYFNYKDKKSGKIEKFTLDKTMAKKEDENFYYFTFLLKNKELHYSTN